VSSSEAASPEAMPARIDSSEAGSDANARVAHDTPAEPRDDSDTGSTATTPAESAANEDQARAADERAASEDAPMTEALDQTTQPSQTAEAVEAGAPAAANHEPDAATSDTASDDIARDVTPAPTAAQANEQEEHEDQKQYAAGPASHDAAGHAPQNIDDAASGVAAHKDSTSPRVLHDELHGEARSEAEHAEHVKHATGPQSTHAAHGGSQDRRDAGVLTDDEPESRSA
jgi:segregation and condensation protein B